MSIFDDYELNEENFERCIINGMKMPQLLIIFQRSITEMDNWCLATYKKNFRTTYELLRQIACERFSGTMNSLSLRGNNTAINIMDRFLNNVQEDRVVKVVFDSKLEEEKEEDKENNE